MEEVYLLGDQTDACTHCRKANRPQIHAPQAHDARQWIVEAQEEPRQRCLPAPCASHHTQHAARRKRHADVAQDRGVLRIAKGDAVQIHREGSGQQRDARTIGYTRHGTQKPRDTGYAGIRLLQVLHFVADLLGRLAQHLGTLKDQIDGADGQRADLEQHGTQGKGDRRAEHKQPLAGSPHAVAPHLRLARHGQPRSHHLGTAAQHKRASPARPDILQAGQVFAQEAKESGTGLAIRSPGGCGNGADAQHNGQGQHDKGAHLQAYPPVHVIEQPEHTQQQEAVAEHRDHKP